MAPPRKSLRKIFLGKNIFWEKNFLRSEITQNPKFHSKSFPCASSSLKKWKNEEIKGRKKKNNQNQRQNKHTQLGGGGGRQGGGRGGGGPLFSSSVCPPPLLLAPPLRRAVPCAAVLWGKRRGPCVRGGKTRPLPPAAPRVPPRFVSDRRRVALGSAGRVGGVRVAVVGGCQKSAAPLTHNLAPPTTPRTRRPTARASVQSSWGSQKELRVLTTPENPIQALRDELGSIYLGGGHRFRRLPTRRAWPNSGFNAAKRKKNHLQHSCGHSNVAHVALRIWERKTSAKKESNGQHGTPLWVRRQKTNPVNIMKNGSHHTDRTHVRGFAPRAILRRTRMGHPDASQLI